MDPPSPYLFKVTQELLNNSCKAFVKVEKKVERKQVLAIDLIKGLADHKDTLRRFLEENAHRSAINSS